MIYNVLLVSAVQQGESVIHKSRFLDSIPILLHYRVLQSVLGECFSKGPRCDNAVLCLVVQLCLTLRPMDCKPPGSSIHGILQARIKEQVAFPFSRDLPDPGIKCKSPALQVDSLLSEPPWKPRCDYQFSSVAQSCLTLCNPTDFSSQGFLVHHQLPEFTQTHVH